MNDEEKLLCLDLWFESFGFESFTCLVLVDDLRSRVFVCLFESF